MADKPVTREEKYLAYLTGDYTGELPKPITRKEKYLYELCLKGIGGEISPEEIKNAVNEYLEKNPVKPGATTEQAQQIEQNKTDVASLKEETGSLKEDLTQLGELSISDLVMQNQFENKSLTITNGMLQVYTTNTRLKSALIDVNNVYSVKFIPKMGYQFSLYELSSADTVIKRTGWLSDVTEFVLSDETIYLYILISKISNEVISIEEKRNVECIAISKTILNFVEKQADSKSQEKYEELHYDGAAYCYLNSGANLDYTYNDNKCNLKFGNTMTFRLGSTSYAFSLDDIKEAVEVSSVATIDDNGVITGDAFAIVFSKSTKKLKFTRLYDATTNLDYVLIFYHHYNSTNVGLLARYGIENHLKVLEKDFETTKSDVSTLKTDVSTLKASNLPDYVLQEISRVKNRVIDCCASIGNPIIFGVNTDQHYATNTKSCIYGLEAMSELSNMLPFNLNVLCGDIAAYDTEGKNVVSILNEIAEVNYHVSKSGCNVVSITGNHDANQNTVLITNRQLFNAHFKKAVALGYLKAESDDCTNGYIDDESVNIRYIFCDTTSRYDADGQMEYDSTIRCRAWLKNCLSTLPNEYKVITFSHHALTSALNTDHESETGLWQGISCQNVLSEYKDKIICCVSGHWHKSADAVDENGIHYIVVTSSMYSTSTTTVPEIATFPRALGTASETAFDIFCVDQDTRKIYIIRYGAGGENADREFSY